MNTRQLLEIVKSRGMRIKIEDGRPILIRNAGDGWKPGPLLAVLALHRERIIKELSK
jgi:hypothetical protein